MSRSLVSGVIATAQDAKIYSLRGIFLNAQFGRFFWLGARVVDSLGPELEDESVETAWTLW